MAFADQRDDKDFAKNPCTKFYECKSGKFQYYDKETKENVEVPNLRLLILSDRNAMWKGYNEGMKVHFQTFTIFDWSQPMELFYWANGERTVTAKGIYRKIPQNAEEKLFKLEVKEYCKLFKVIFAIDIDRKELVQVTFPTGQYKDVEQSKANWEKVYIKMTGQEKRSDPTLGEWLVPAFELCDMNEALIAYGREAAQPVIDFIKSQKSRHATEEVLSEGEQQNEAYAAAVANMEAQQAPAVEDIPTINADEDYTAVPDQPKQSAALPTTDAPAAAPTGIKYESDIKPEDLPW